MFTGSRRGVCTKHTNIHTHAHIYLVKEAQHESCEVQQMYSSNKEAVCWQVMLFRACLGL